MMERALPARVSQLPNQNGVATRPPFHFLLISPGARAWRRSAEWPAPCEENSYGTCASWRRRLTERETTTFTPRVSVPRAGRPESS